MSRRHLRAVWGLASGLWLASCATTETHPSGPKVKSLEIVGTHDISAGELKKKILTSESSFWPFGGPEYFDSNAWQGDLRRIERYYQAHGYYQAEVLQDEVLPDGDNAVRLRVKVKEGEATKLGAMRIEGLESLPQDQQAIVIRGAPLKVNEIFLEEDWAAMKSRLQSNLRELGYAEAEVTGEAEVDTARRLATAKITVKPGHRYRFGKIFVATDEHPRIPPKRIIEQAQGAVSPGTWYSDSALAEAQARVFRMGVFGGVKVNRGAPDKASETVPVVIDVREAPFHTVKGGGGFGLDQTRNEVRVSGEYTDRNFLGDLRRFTLQAKVGYALLPDIISGLILDPGAAVQPCPPQGEQKAGFAPGCGGFIFKALTELEQPHFFSRDWRLETSLSAERGLEYAYTYLSGRAKVGAVWQPHPAFSIYPSFNFEVDTLRGPLSASTAISPLVLGCQPGSSATCTLPVGYLEQVIEWDRRDDKSEPRRGFYLAIDFQEGLFGNNKAGDPATRFLRVRPDARAYVTFGEQDEYTVAARVKLGTLLTLGGESPIISRFFSGGPEMRGFNPRRLSPEIELGTYSGTSQTPTAALWVPIGGDGLFEASVELRRRLNDKLELAFFVDAGTVTKSAFSPSDIFAKPQIATGIGARYLTLVGPLRVDLAIRLPIGDPLGTPDPTLVTVAPVTPACFFFGRVGPKTPGYPEGFCALHLSVGEAF